MRVHDTCADRRQSHTGPGAIPQESLGSAHLKYREGDTLRISTVARETCLFASARSTEDTRETPVWALCTPIRAVARTEHACSLLLETGMQAYEESPAYGT